MEYANARHRSKTGRLLTGGIAFLIILAFIQAGLRHSAAGGAQKIGGGGRSIVIDVNPGGSKGIDLSSRDKLPVAVLGDKNFNVASIDQSSLSFGGVAVTKKHSARPLTEKRTREAKPRLDVEVRDVNGDGYNDLVARFPIAFMRDLSAGTVTATLKGRLLDGSAITGSETVRTWGESPIHAGATNAPRGDGYCNLTSIVLPADPPGAGNATPYPSTINVTGAPTSITGVTVTLNNLSHTFPDDLDIILVSPTGQVMILDNGGWNGTDAINATVSFSSTAVNYPPDNAPLTSGTYKPVSYYPEFSFASPAPALTPAAPYAHTFNAFMGSDANGTWSLYVRDDAELDTGMIAGGWCISFPTTTPGCANQLFQGSLDKGDATMTDRLFRDVISALCGSSGKPCPDLDKAPGPFAYDTYTITNNSMSVACLTASLTGDCANAMLSAYQTSFNPSSLCTNYLNGSSLVDNVKVAGTSETQTMSMTLAPGASIVFVVNEITAGNGCANYSLLVEGNICGGCTLTCPANITQPNDPNQCGAVVNYPAPTTSGSCGTVTCSPASGTSFPKGTTTVTCTASGGGAPSCSFTVTVNDLQPPTITCPAGVTSVSPAPGTGGVVTYPPPTASDNCPGVTTSCTPPSGSTFPLGTTSVTCTATDASGNTASCSFTVTVFDGRLQDDSQGCNNTVLFNTVTGDYRWCCHGTIFTGRAKVTRAGNVYNLFQGATDRRVQISLDAGSVSPHGNASLQVPVGTIICTITDRDIRNDTCLCGAAPPPTSPTK